VYNSGKTPGIDTVGGSTPIKQLENVKDLIIYRYIEGHFSTPAEETYMPERRARRSPGQTPIEVIISDGTHHHLAPQVLDVLLENNRVLQFRRANGWAVVGMDPIRVRNRREASHFFNGPDRRSAC
jgi:hypothetical protein